MSKNKVNNRSNNYYKIKNDNYVPPSKKTQEFNSNKEQKVQEESLEKVETDQQIELKLLDSFEELNLKENLLRGIFSYGFVMPSRIQS